MKDNLLKSIMSGVYLTMAALIYLIVNNELVNGAFLASVLFSFALLLIVAKDYNLYTGKIGYLLPYEKGNFKNIVITLLGNIVGIVVTCGLILLAGNVDISSYANTIVNVKFNNEWYQTLILAIFCGMLMYTAVDGYKKIKDPIIKVLIVMLSVIFFLLAGFEHSIANIIYVVLAKTISIKIVFYILMMIIGNAIGAIALNLIHNKIKK